MRNLFGTLILVSFFSACADDSPESSLKVSDLLDPAEEWVAVEDGEMQCVDENGQTKILTGSSSPPLLQANFSELAAADFEYFTDCNQTRTHETHGHSDKIATHQATRGCVAIKVCCWHWKVICQEK